MQLNGMSTGFRARGWVGFDIVILESDWRPPRALVRCGKPATMQGGLTNRWTRAAGACLVTSLVRRRVFGFAPPRQLNRWASLGTHASGCRIKRTGSVTHAR